jgi:hypothetical protein
MKPTYISARAAEIIRQRNLTIDETPATRLAAGESKPLSASEKLDIFLRVHGREFPNAEVQRGWIRMQNAANAERWGR